MAGANPRRILSIWLPRLAIERWQRHVAPPDAAAQPVALVSDTAHGPRVVAVNPPAAQAGVRAGARLADMRALCPELTSQPHDPDADRALLHRFALAAQRWGPLSAIDPPDGLLVDLTGAAHLFGGEGALVDDLVRRFGAQGFTATAGIAATAGAAWALGHFSPAGLRINPPGRDLRDALAPLPVAALRLDPEVIVLLRRLGLKRIGDLLALDRQALARRFRQRRSVVANPLIRLDQMLGEMAEPLLLVVGEAVPWVQRRLMEPLLHRSLLDRVVADLARDLCALLEARRLGARRLVLRLYRVDGDVIERRLELSAASRDPAHIVRLFADRLERIDAGFGIDQCQLLSPWFEPLALVQTDLDAQPHRGTTLAQCVDRLSARLGAAAITTPVSHPSHLPERSQRWVATQGRPVAAAHQMSLGFHSRPLRLFDRPEPIEVVYGTPEDPPRRFRWRSTLHAIARVEGPERIAPEWWRERSTIRLRDYYMIENKAGQRFWLYRHGHLADGRGGPPDWFLHGIG